jgi:hypothetical protein
MFRSERQEEAVYVRKFRLVTAMIELECGRRSTDAKEAFRDGKSFHKEI